jgi:hypothetical protein
VLKEEKLDAVHARLATSTRKSLKQLAQVTSVMKTFAHKIVTALIVKENSSPGFEGTGGNCENTLWKNSEVTPDARYQQFLGKNSRE